VDDAIGQIVGALDAQGLRENTLVLLTADNGPADLSSVVCDNVGSQGPFTGQWQETVGGGGTGKVRAGGGGETARCAGRVLGQLGQCARALLGLHSRRTLSLSALALHSLCALTITPCALPAHS
jgi:arylsulfatase A-like enzyme